MKHEVKSVDLIGAPITLNLSTTAGFQLLNGTQTGTGFWNRIGRKIQMKSLHLTGAWSADNGTISPDPHQFEYLRIMVVYDAQPNGSTPPISAILQNRGDDGTAYTNAISGVNMDNADRFRILADIRWTNFDDSVAPGEAGEAMMNGYNQELLVNRFINLRGLETVYSGSANPATIAQITTGALYLITFGNNIAAKAPFSFTFNARLRFCDV